MQVAFPELEGAKAAAQRVFGIIDRRARTRCMQLLHHAPTSESAALQTISCTHARREPPIDSGSAEGSALATVDGRIDLEDVSCAYPSRPGRLVFKGFSLSVPAGEWQRMACVQGTCAPPSAHAPLPAPQPHTGSSCALVGESGSGQSTVVGLEQRYYDPLGGQVG